MEEVAGRLDSGDGAASSLEAPGVSVTYVAGSAPTHAAHAAGARSLHHRPQVLGGDPRIQRGERRTIDLPAETVVGWLEIQHEPIGQRRLQAGVHEPSAPLRATGPRGGRAQHELAHAPPPAPP